MLVVAEKNALVHHLILAKLRREDVVDGELERARALHDSGGGIAEGNGVRT